MNNYNRGLWAEFLARMYMRMHGYQILQERYKSGRGTGAGEIDFIALRRHTIVFVEVKERNDFSTAAYAISETQKKRLYNGAKNFIKHNPQYKNHDMRFDAILLVFPWRIRHLENIVIDN